jgi:hypothetical protein
MSASKVSIKFIEAGIEAVHRFIGKEDSELWPMIIRFDDVDERVDIVFTNRIDNKNYRVKLYDQYGKVWAGECEQAIGFDF